MGAELIHEDKETHRHDKSNRNCSLFQTNTPEVGTPTPYGVPHCYNWVHRGAHVRER